jgi:SAM-dependent methyltransferase
MTTLERTRGFYRERYRAAPGAMRDYRLYLPLLGGVTHGRILDIGCGEGHFLEAAAAAGLAPTGVEIVPEALLLARARLPAAGWVLAAGEDLPFPDETFDAVTCLGTLEHFVDPEGGAREVARVLKRSGQALIVVPNLRFLWWTLSGSPGTEQQDAAELLLDRSGWTALLEGAGLEVVSVVAEPWYSKPAPVWKAFVRRSAWSLLPLRRTYQLAFLCRRSG